jgi:hypothetical protein
MGFVNKYLVRERVYWSGVIIYLTMIMIYPTLLNFFLEESYSLNSLIQWDANDHYLFIRNNGYVFNGCDQPETAFFPLFPFLWKLVPATGLGALLLNSALFFPSLVFLKKEFRVSNRHLFIWLSLPSMFFL